MFAKLDHVELAAYKTPSCARRDVDMAQKRRASAIFARKPAEPYQRELRLDCKALKSRNNLMARRLLSTASSAAVRRCRVEIELETSQWVSSMR
jgi:hypothetical protein